MPIENDEFITYHQAQMDWRDDGSSLDAESWFQFLSHYTGMSHDTVGSKYEIEVTPNLSVDNRELYVGWRGVGSQQIVWRSKIQFKVPMAPQKNVYIKQMILLMPFDSATSDIDISVTDYDYESALILGKSSGAKFGNQYHVAYYGSKLDGSAHTSGSEWDDMYGESGFWNKRNGLDESWGRVKDKNPIFPKFKYPLGGGDVIEITEISLYSENKLKSLGGSVYDWWAFNLAPMTISSPIVPGSKLEYTIWARYDINDTVVPVFGLAACQMVYAKFFNSRNRNITGRLPDSWPEGASSPVFTNINIDGHGRDVGDEIVRRPVLGILWKKKLELDVAQTAEYVKAVPVKGKTGVIVLEWNPAKDEDFIKCNINRYDTAEVTATKYTEYTTTDAELGDYEIYAYPGFLRTSPKRYFLAIENILGGHLAVPYLSNFLEVYRPFCNDQWSLGPVLVNSAGSPGVPTTNVDGHDILEQLWPIVSGVDGFWTGDEVQVNTRFQIIDKDLNTPPGVTVVGQYYIIGSQTINLLLTSSGPKTLVVVGNVTATIAAGDVIKVNDATTLGLNGEYNVVSAIFGGVNTVIVVTEDVVTTASEGVLHHANGVWNIIGPDHCVEALDIIGATWVDHGTVELSSVFVNDETKYYTYFAGELYKWVLDNIVEYLFTYESRAQDYSGVQDVCVVLESGSPPTDNDNSVRRRILSWENDILSLVPPTDESLIPVPSEDDPYIFPIRKRISKVYFKFGDGGQGSTDEIFELIKDYGWDEETNENKEKDNFLEVSDTSFLKIGDRICIMDGLKGRTYTISDIIGNTIETVEAISVYLSRRTQGYKCPPYVYTNSGLIEFAGTVENEDGFKGDWYSVDYKYDMADVAPVAVLSAEKLIVEKGVGNIVRLIGIESILKSFGQKFGVGNAQYNFDDSTGFTGWQNNPYLDVSWAGTGTKTCRLQVRNASALIAANESPIVTMNIEVVDELDSGIYQFISLTDFTNGYVVENISGGREVEIETDSTGGSKEYDNSEKSVRTVSLRGTAKTHTTVHPIAVVEVWKLTQSVGVQALPDDMVTLKFLEETAYGAKITLEGDIKNCLLEPLGRTRGWGDGIKRRWDATFVIME